MDASYYQASSLTYLLMFTFVWRNLRHTHILAQDEFLQVVLSLSLFCHSA